MTVCLFLSLADTCVKARAGRKAVERLNMSHKETFIISEGGGRTRTILKKSLWQLGKTNFKTKNHLNANSNLFCSVFASW